MMKFQEVLVLVFAAMMGVGTFLQLISYATPGWSVFEYKNQFNVSWFYFHEKLQLNHTYYWGMWFYRICDTSDNCILKSYHDEYHSNPDAKDEKTGIKWTHGNMYEYMVLEQMRVMVSFICSLCACVALVLYLRLQRFHNFWSFLVVVLTAISETLAFQLIVEYGHNERWSSTYKRYLYEHAHQIPYSIVLCAFGLVLKLPASIHCTIRMNKELY